LGNGHRRSYFHHRHRRSENRGEAEHPLCPLCQKPVRELASAIAHRETGSPAHFDCILRLLREENTPGENEKICYLGNGSFGVVQFRGGSPLRFFVRKRIQYEKTDPPPEWRRQSSRGLGAR
jgi:hypothetical protein